MKHATVDLRKQVRWNAPREGYLLACEQISFYLRKGGHFLEAPYLSKGNERICLTYIVR